MKKINYPTGKEITIYHASGITAGYGHKEITIEIEYNGEYRKFSAITNDMPGWDEANDLDDYDERKEALYELVEANIEGNIEEFIYDVDFDEEEEEEVYQVDSWNNPIERIHYQKWSDGTTTDRPMTDDEMKEYPEVQS